VPRDGTAAIMRRRCSESRAISMKRTSGSTSRSSRYDQDSVTEFLIVPFIARYDASLRSSFVLAIRRRLANAAARQTIGPSNSPKATDS